MYVAVYKLCEHIWDPFGRFHLFSLDSWSQISKRCRKGDRKSVETGKTLKFIFNVFTANRKRDGSSMKIAIFDEFSRFNILCTPNVYLLLLHNVLYPIPRYIHMYVDSTYVHTYIGTSFYNTWMRAWNPKYSSVTIHAISLQIYLMST
jgi:hypothetical protein